MMSCWASTGTLGLLPARMCSPVSVSTLPDEWFEAYAVPATGLLKLSSLIQMVMYYSIALHHSASFIPLPNDMTIMRRIFIHGGGDGYISVD